MSNYTGGVKQRRKKVIERLETQLKLGSKQQKSDFNTMKILPLTEKDVKRIKSEILILKEKI